MAKRAHRLLTPLSCAGDHARAAASESSCTTAPDAAGWSVPATVVTPDAEVTVSLLFSMTWAVPIRINVTRMTSTITSPTTALESFLTVSFES